MPSPRRPVSVEAVRIGDGGSVERDFLRCRPNCGEIDEIDLRGSLSNMLLSTTWQSGLGRDSRPPKEIRQNEGGDRPMNQEIIELTEEPTEQGGRSTIFIQVRL